jgi:uncharacterized protein (TIGR00251 family)
MDFDKWKGCVRKVLQPGTFEIDLWVQPGASRTQFVSLHGQPPRLKIQVAAPPESGQANEALLRFLKKSFKGPVFLIGGTSSRAKTVRVQTTDVLLNDILEPLQRKVNSDVSPNPKKKK